MRACGDDATQRNNGERTEGKAKHGRKAGETKKGETFGPNRMFARSYYAASAEERLSIENGIPVFDQHNFAHCRARCVGHLAHLPEMTARFFARTKLNNRFAIFFSVPVSATVKLHVYYKLSPDCVPSRADRMATEKPPDRSAHNVRVMCARHRVQTPPKMPCSLCVCRRSICLRRLYF